MHTTRQGAHAFSVLFCCRGLVASAVALSRLVICAVPLECGAARGGWRPLDDGQPGEPTGRHVGSTTARCAARP